MQKFQLRRIGRRGLPCFRLVIKENRGQKLIQEVGFYSPVSKQFKITNPRVMIKKWRPSNRRSKTVESLFWKHRNYLLKTLIQQTKRKLG